MLEGSGGTQSSMLPLCNAGPVPQAQRLNSSTSGLLFLSTSAIPNLTEFFPRFPDAAGQTSGENNGASSSIFLIAVSTFLLRERQTLNGISNGLSDLKAPRTEPWLRCLAQLRGVSLVGQLT